MTNEAALYATFVGVRLLWGMVRSLVTDLDIFALPLRYSTVDRYPSLRLNSKAPQSYIIPLVS